MNISYCIFVLLYILDTLYVNAYATRIGFGTAFLINEICYKSYEVQIISHDVLKTQMSHLTNGFCGT